MKNIITAIFTKLSGSDLSNAIGGRMFLDRAENPDGDTEYPYIVLSVVNAPLEKTFTEEYRDTQVQFSIYSIARSAVEITTIYDYLKALYDECGMTITDNTLVWCRETNLVTMYEDTVNTDGTNGCRHWAAEYEIRTSLN